MMDDIAEILKGKNFVEPPQVAAIKKFVTNKFGYTPQVLVQNNSIVIVVNSAGLANNIRLSTPQIIEECGIKTRLLIRIK